MIGVRLFDLRKDWNETQKELGDLIGVSNFSVSAYERDESEPPDAVKVKIAEHYNVSLDFLLGLVDQRQPIKYGTAEYLPFPSFLPAEARKEAEEFIEYLKTKYSEAENKP